MKKVKYIKDITTEKGKKPEVYEIEFSKTEELFEKVKPGRTLYFQIERKQAPSIRYTATRLNNIAKKLGKIPKDGQKYSVSTIKKRGYVAISNLLDRKAKSDEKSIQ